MMFIAVSMQAQDIVKDTLRFESNATVSAKDLLRGQVAGVRVSGTDGNFNSTMNTTIRSLNSLRGVSEPLWIVDGVYLNSTLTQNSYAFWQDRYVSAGNGYTTQINPLFFLSPQDIESVEVIKDISEAAKYGANGANGVIIVKTKNAEEGKLQVDWLSNVGVNVPYSGYGNVSVSHNHNVAVSSAQNRNTYRISLNLRDNNGTLPTQDNLFGGMSINFDSKANSAVWFGLNSYISAGKMSSPNGTAWYGAPSMMLAHRGIGAASVNDWAEDYDDHTTDYRTINTAYLTINFLPSLTWENNLGLDFENNTRYIWYGKKTEFGAANNGAAAILNSAMFGYNFRSKLAYTLMSANGHKANFSVGFAANGNIDKFNNMNGYSLETHKLRARGLNFSNSKAELHKFNRDYGHIAAFASASYSYKGFAGVEAMYRAENTARYDGSDFISYPSVDAYVDLHGLLFPDCTSVSTLKLEGGWGIAGKEVFVPYEMFGHYTPGGYIDVPQEIAIVYEGFNRLKTTEWNAGFSTGFMSDRITAALKYYSKTTVDTFSTYCFGKSNSIGIWTATSGELVQSHYGTVRNRGFELTLNADIIKTKNVRWNLNANLAYNANQIISAVAENDKTCTDINAPEGGSVNINALGYTVGALYGYETDSNGAYVDQTGDGKIRQEDRVILGNTQPKLMGGLSTSLSLYGFTFEADFDGSWGHSLLNMNRMMQDQVNNPTQTVLVSEKYVENASFLRIGRVALNYDVPVANVKWIHNARVTLSADNPCIFTKYSGLNPDVDSFGTDNFSRGIDYGAFPIVKTVVLGFKLTF